MWGERKAIFGEKGPDSFGEALEDQRKGKAFLACEGAEVFWIGWERGLLSRCPPQSLMETTSVGLFCRKRKFVIAS